MHINKCRCGEISTIKTIVHMKYINPKYSQRIQNLLCNVINNPFDSSNKLQLEKETNKLYKKYKKIYDFKDTNLKNEFFICQEIICKETGYNFEESCSSRHFGESSPGMCCYEYTCEKCDLNLNKPDFLVFERIFNPNGYLRK